MKAGRVFHRSRESGHWQVETLCPDGQVWPIDVAMVPLLQRLWDSGIETWVCCQGVTLTEYQAARGGLPYRWGYSPNPRKGAINCYLGIVGDPYAAATLLTSWGLPPVEVSVNDLITQHWAKRGLLQRTSIDLDILAFRAWCEKNGVDTEPRWV